MRYLCTVKYNLFSADMLYKVYMDKYLASTQKQSEVFCKKGILRNFAKFTGKHPATLLKKRLWHRCFPVNFAKFLRVPLLTEHLRCCFCPQFEFFKKCCIICYQFLKSFRPKQTYASQNFVSENSKFSDNFQKFSDMQ